MGGWVGGRRTRMGAVAVWGTVPKRGARKTEQKKKKPIVTAVSPVLPPSLMPAAVSTCTITGVLPVNPPTTVPTAEERKAHTEPGMVSSGWVSFASLPIPNITPEISKIPTKMKAWWVGGWVVEKIEETNAVVRCCTSCRGGWVAGGRRKRTKRNTSASTHPPTHQPTYHHRGDHFHGEGG